MMFNLLHLICLDEVALDTPFKALFSLADWTNVAMRVLNEIRHHPGSSSPASNELKEAAGQLIDSYPVRAQSSFQYLQQYLSMQEQYLVQQKSLLHLLVQQQQQFLTNIDSLHPIRSNPTSSASLPSPRLGVPAGQLRNPAGSSSFLPQPTPSNPGTASASAAPTNGNLRPVASASSSNSMPANSRSTTTSSNGSSRKRGLGDVDPTVNFGPLYPGDPTNGIPSESMVTIILAKRVALTENTDDFGLPAYTTNTPNGVSLVSDLFK